MLMRFDPFRDLDRVAQMLTQGTGPVRPAMMPMDAYRDGDRFVIQFDLPGVDPNSIDLTVEKNVLTVRAERTPQPAEGRDVLVAERPQGAFTRQLFLGESLDTDHIQATYDQGVLTLTIPVQEQAKPRKVTVIGNNGASRQIETEAAPATSSAA
jgi:HSP20 family protein